MSELPSRVSFAARSPCRCRQYVCCFSVVIVGEAMQRINLATAVLSRSRSIHNSSFVLGLQLFPCFSFLIEPSSLGLVQLVCAYILIGVLVACYTKLPIFQMKIYSNPKKPLWLGFDEPQPTTTNKMKHEIYNCKVRILIGQTVVVILNILRSIMIVVIFIIRQLLIY